MWLGQVKNKHIFYFSESHQRFSEFANVRVHSIKYSTVSVTRLGDKWMLMATNTDTKVAQIFGGFSENHHFLRKN